MLLPFAARPSLLVAFGPGSLSALHAHHAWHLIIARTGALKVRTSVRGPLRDAGAVLVAPDQPHSIDARGLDVAIIFIDAESDLAASLSNLLEPGPDRRLLLAARPTNSIRADLPSIADGAALLDRVPRLLAHLGVPPSQPRRRMHPAVRRTLATLASAPAPSDVALSTLAAQVGLSESRLQHAFRESVGLPIRPYVLWTRLLRAGAAIASGSSLTAAAHEAGFSDAAHMTRTFRRMFGVTPSELRPRAS